MRRIMTATRNNPLGAMGKDESNAPVPISIGIMAWNEEQSIGTTLASLFRQSVFERLSARHARCEILCLANGCTDRTVDAADEIFSRQRREHPHASAFAARVANLSEPGRNNAWNRFVHELSAREARFLCLMDADIVLHERETIDNMLAALERDDHAFVSTDRPCKDLLLKPRKSLRDRLSLATSEMTGAIEGCFSGQLYCLRSSIARNLYLPRDLGATDDGFLKAVICTDFLTRETEPRRIVVAPHAAHIYEAYVSARDVLNNQKRQMIGQATVHVLLEYLKTLPVGQRLDLAETLRRHEEADPDWLKKLFDRHVRRTRFFWRLFPGLLSFRFRRLWQLKGARRITHFPAALTGFVVTLIASWRAFRFLKQGRTFYWPKAGRRAILNLPPLPAK